MACTWQRGPCLSSSLWFWSPHVPLAHLHKSMRTEISNGSRITRSFFYVVVAIRVLGFFLLYGGIITVIVGVYSMTPETANGRGAVPLVGDGKVPGSDQGVPGYEGIKEPYGANDIPGVAAEAEGEKGDAGMVGFF